MSLEKLCEAVRIFEKASEEIVILKIFQTPWTSDLTVFGDCHQRRESNRAHGKNDASVFNLVWRCRFSECSQFADLAEVLESMSDHSPIPCES
jgi:hypothetical protein